MALSETAGSDGTSAAAPGLLTIARLDNDTNHDLLSVVFLSILVSKNYSAKVKERNGFRRLKHLKRSGESKGVMLPRCASDSANYRIVRVTNFVCYVKVIIVGITTRIIIPIVIIAIFVVNV